MPLARDEQGGGTNADGTLSTAYCSHCYQAGAFTMPDLAVLEMQERVETKLKQAGVPSTFIGKQVQKIPTLARWSR